MRRQFINHWRFRFDHAFNEKATNEEVYNHIAAPLVKYTVLEAGYSTILMYGQTGSGKSYTMNSIYTLAAADVFATIDEVSPRFSSQFRVSLSFIELSGDACYDLLNCYSPVQLLTGPAGGVHAFPVAEPEVASVEELAALINYACEVRSTAATGVHDSSSRSHAILKIYVEQPRSSSLSSSNTEKGNFLWVSCLPRFPDCPPFTNAFVRLYHPLPPHYSTTITTLLYPSFYHHHYHIITSSHDHMITSSHYHIITLSHYYRRRNTYSRRFSRL